jgi:hypothetical protein
LLNAGALSDIANGTGDYLLLAGNKASTGHRQQCIDDQLLKHFAQVLAGATER